MWKEIVVNDLDLDVSREVGEGTKSSKEKEKME